MIKRLFLSLALAMLVPAAPAFAQDVMTAETAAAGIQPLVGKEYEGGIKFVSVAAEANNTLVLTIDGQQGWNGITSDQITEIFLSGFCQEPKAAAFVKTGWVRVDMLDHGADLKRGKPSNTCPAPSDAK